MAKKKNPNPKTVSAPAAMGTKTKGATVPTVRYSKDGSCSISHMEYVGDVVTSTTTAEYTYACNPQNGTTFTWLSALATRFEMYRFKRLKFMYKPSCSTATTGYIVLGFDFDSYDDFPTKVSMLAWKYSSKSAVWQECGLDVSQDSRLSTFRYCNYDATAGDKRLDFLGNLFILANGPTLTAGEIYVSYECEFRQPAYKIPPALAFRVFNPDMTNLNDFFPSNLVPTGNLDIDFNSVSQLLIKTAGKYLISQVTKGTGISGFSDLTFAAGNVAAKFTESNRSVSTSATQASSYFYLDVLVPPVLASFSALTGIASASSDVIIATYFA